MNLGNIKFLENAKLHYMDLFEQYPENETFSEKIADIDGQISVLMGY